MLDAAREAFDSGDIATAAQAFGQVLQMDRENTAAIAGLARCQIASGNLDGARATLALTPPARMNDADIVSARAALELAETPVNHGEIARLTQAVEANPRDHQARIDLALALSGAGRREEALDHLLESIRMDREWNDQAARKQLVKLFDAWGPRDELTMAGRRRLSSILFS